MGTTGRLAGLAGLVCLGCTFESVGDNGNALGGAGSSSSTASGDPGEDSTSADEAGSGGAEGPSVAGSTSVGNDAACVDACIPQAPVGWRGPYYAAEAADEIECPAGHDVQDVAYTELVASEADCLCSCDATPGSCHVEVLLSSLGCPLGLAESLTDGQCADNNTFGIDVHARATLVGSPGACTPNLVETATPPEWMTTVTLCAAPARGGDCGPDRCTVAAPEELETLACVSKDGDHPCPGGGYSARAIYYRSIDDDRSCEGCSCDGSTTCNATAFAHDSASCSGDGQPLPFDDCVDINVSGGYGVTASIEADTCTPGEATTSGEAMATDPVTVCCAE